VIDPRGQLQLAHGGLHQCLAGLIQRDVLPNLSRSYGVIISEVITFLVLSMIKTKLMLIFVNIFSKKSYSN
jgi:hypothetical protein